jgi:hypothetical protein
MVGISLPPNPLNVPGNMKALSSTHFLAKKTSGVEMKFPAESAEDFPVVHQRFTLSYWSSGLYIYRMFVGNLFTSVGKLEVL